MTRAKARAGFAAPLCALALVLAATPALADARLVERMYDPAAVVKIEGRTKVQATIQFGDDESIENVAIGDSASWQVTPNKRANLLFVKPLEATASTNMTVVTNKRTYLFDLVANPRARPLYVLKFTYPDEPEEETLLAGPVEVADPTEMAAATDPYAVVDPAQLNFAWAVKGDRGLVPERTYDDGTATFLAWPAGAPVPAILVKDADGTEGPVNFTVRGDVIVVDGVPREIVLRSGDNAATLTNTGPVRPAPTSSALPRAASGPAAAQSMPGEG
ncbi:TrbG/VirB9 family P-type conjugative transfer protein [Altererythrobacter sp. H2]|uniref:TrbG/VirB9 family P-type conjugative transfer protein n=1 Tax=Altererythrobacter sp. H2 TaxID=3108391 RepID=UPI002B4BC384|nr:TrbG/VirB9 family P-type conjugative transfer protein [Altererythrobacter sp. H2]WRK96654.1 TrbG/VirB9 family P-type conjugative transfer protein [Altererythrobacter sp. H2]